MTQNYRFCQECHRYGEHSNGCPNQPDETEDELPDPQDIEDEQDGPY